jgi:asparagine synthase (glutamine-hydrolysing)
MCGILGLAGLSEAEFGESFDRSMRRLEWRGADGSGRCELLGMRLGCQRLAITDAGSGQPIVDGEPGQRLAVVFNGNVAGDAEWRARLAAAGEACTTRNDAELPLRIWRAFGLAGLRELEGQFAFGLLDEEREQLVLARDRFGEKPLFVRERDGGWPDFASTCAALPCAGHLPGDASTADGERMLPRSAWPPLRALSAYLLRGWWGEAALPEGVRAVRPGGLELWSEGGLRKELSTSGADWGRCARVEEARGEEAQGEEAQGEEAQGEEARRGAPGAAGPAREELGLEEVLLRAVERRLGGDREIALFLSGGLDSTALACALQELGLRVRCYAADFEFGSQEGARAEAVARALGFDCRRVRLGPELLDELPRLLQLHGRPFGDASLLALYGLSRAARDDGIGVALLGDGGDELFAGYRRQRAWPWARELSTWVGPWLRPLAERAHGELGRLARAAVSGDYARLWEQARPRDVFRLLGRSGESRAEGIGTRWSGPDARFADTSEYLVEDLCVKSDLATLAAGIEGRAPLLDPALARALLRRSPGLGERSSKMSLRGFVARHLPAPLREGRKRGFGLPLAHWLAHTSFLDRSWQRLGTGPLDLGLLRRWTYELRTGDDRRAFLLWHAATLAWHP